MEEIDQLNVSTLLNEANIGVVVHRWDTSIVYANPTALRLLRLTAEQIKGKDAFDPTWHFIDDNHVQLSIENFPVNKLKRERSNLTNFVVGIVDQRSIDPTWVSVNAYIENTSDNIESSKLVVTFTDISDVKRSFSYHQILENTQDMVVVTEADNISMPFGPKIVYVNQAFVDITGYTQEEVIGKTPRILQGKGTDKNATKRIKQALQKKQPITETILNYDKQQNEYWIELSIIPLTNSVGEVTHFAAIERDVSEKKFYLEQLERSYQATSQLNKAIEEKAKELEQAKKQLESIAFLDPLTQAPNRRYFYTHAPKVQKSATRNSKSVAMGLIDVDDFKAFNDTYGHDIGDQVLIAIADSLKQFFREDDLYCRYGGEEFAFAVALSNLEDCKHFAQRLIDKIRQCHVVLNADQSLSITATIGIKLVHHAAHCSIEQALKSADTALYQAKKSGKDQFLIFCDF